MTPSGIIQIVLYVAVLVALVKPLGSYMVKVHEAEPCGLDRIVGPFERCIYRLLGIKPENEMSWKEYAGAAIFFKLSFLFLLYAILRQIVEIGKQLLMIRGTLTTFSIANDVAKYFAILPVAFILTYPQLAALNIMHLSTPQSAILSAVIFNALIIIALIPLALRGVAYRPMGAAVVLRNNLLLYGLGGLMVPFVGIR